MRLDSFRERLLNFDSLEPVVCGVNLAGGFGREILVPIRQEQRIIGRWGDFVKSAQGIRISSVDDLLEKTSGVDVAFISAFTDFEWRYYKNHPNEDYNQTDDPAKYLSKHGSQVLDRYADTDKLWKALNRYQFGLVSLSGLYKERGGYESSEKTFMVLNESSGFDTASFFKIIVDLGNSFGQMSVLLKPAEGVEFGGVQMEGEVGYYCYLDSSPHAGQFEQKGKLHKVDVEGWFRMNADLQDTGASRLLGTQEAFVYSSFIIQSVDFSHMADWPGSTEYRNRSIVCSRR
jgi:hypothetical protein